MGTCLEGFFVKGVPKEDSIIMNSSPHKLTSLMGLNQNNRDQFYCADNINKIESILNIYYTKMNKKLDQRADIPKDNIIQNINNVEMFINEMKDQNSKTFKKFIRDKQQIQYFYKSKQICRSKSFAKKNSYTFNNQNDSKPIQSHNIQYNDLIVLKLFIKSILVSSPLKTCKIMLNQQEYSTLTFNKQSQAHSMISGDSQNSSKKIKKTKNQNSQIQKQDYLRTYTINQFINIVTLKSNQIIIVLPQLNVHATILLSDLIFRRNEIILSDMIPFKDKNDDLLVKGYLAVSAQAFLSINFEEDYYNIIKQHQMLKKQLDYCLNNNWQRLHELKNSSASRSQRSMQRQESQYSQFIKQSHQFQVKY